MIGGEHTPLTGALLRDWIVQGVFEQRLTAWADSLGGKIVRHEVHPTPQFAEGLQTTLAKGQSITPILAQTPPTPTYSYRWAEIDAPPPTPTPLTNPRWVWIMEGYPVNEIVHLLGPKGGDRGRLTVGWTYIVRYDKMPAGSWFEPTGQKGVGSFDNSTAYEKAPNGEYPWLWGFAHVAILGCDIRSLTKAVYANELMADIVASMFNNMLAHLELAPEGVAVPTTPPRPLPTFERQLTQQQSLMVERAKNRREEVQARIASAEASIQSCQEEITSHKRRLTSLANGVPNLQDRLQAILDKGLCSAIKQDGRGLWFLFDDIHAVVSAELATRARINGHTVTPGIYKLVPAVIHLAWNSNGSQWRCGTLTGESHPHSHAANGGPFGAPCLGNTPGSLGPPGVTPAAWFAQLWDEDPVKWAELIHAYMRQTNYGAHNYRGIWDCGTLVTSHEAKLKVTKLPTPTLTVNRLRVAETEGA